MLTLLPGMDGTGTLFGPLQRALAERGLASEPVAYDRADACRYDELLPRILDRLPTDRPHVLVAESYSGPLALRLAAEQPPGLRALVLCATFARLPCPDWLRGPLGRALELPLPTAPPVLAIRTVMTGWDATDAIVGATWQATRAVSGATFRARLRNVLTVDARAAAERIAVPTLVLRATRDRLVPRSATDELVRLLPDAWCVDVDAAHLVLQAAPDASAEAIAAFLGQVRD